MCYFNLLSESGLFPGIGRSRDDFHYIPSPRMAQGAKPKHAQPPANESLYFEFFLVYMDKKNSVVIIGH
jgi:hypothetical protein